MRYDDYPPQYRQMFQKAVREPVILDFTTKAKAIAFRVELYTYRYSVRDSLPGTKNLYEIVMAIKMSIKGKNLTLTIKKDKFVEKLNER